MVILNQEAEPPEKLSKLQCSIKLDSINQILSAVKLAYEEIVQWKRNLFKLRTGSAGRDFLEEMIVMLNMFNSSSAMKSAAITMVMIMPPLLLQKPSRNSKAKGHKIYLEKQLTLWKKGKIQELIRECRVIQRKLTQGKKKTENVEKVFVRLMLQGKVSAAPRWIGSQRSGRMEITEDVLDVLRKKRSVVGRFYGYITFLFSPESFTTKVE